MEAELERPADAAVVGIVLMNVVVMFAALISGDGLVMLMWPYWIQSIVIGYFNVRRIQKLQRFSTDGLKINNRSVSPTPSTRRQTWMFFTVHYGFFHFGYMVFLLTLSNGELASWGPMWFAVTAVGYLLSHGQSHREHVDADLRGTPNIGTLMFIPYIRIVPMHLTIIIGATLSNGPGLLVFAVLKTIADVAMHKVEHRTLQKLRNASA